MVIKRFTDIINKKVSAIQGQDDIPVPDGDSPEANVGRGVRLFCESGGPENAGGEEVLHLPVIVEAAESSPSAAAVAAQQIRKFLSKENHSRPHVQYNAIMLVRILADNPGATFTRNVDQKFTSTVKELLRNSRDPSVQQIMRETLQALYSEKAYDTNLSMLFSMWTKEQNNASSHLSPGTAAWTSQQRGSQSQQPSDGRHRSRGRGLPPPAELAARIEEARTSAKLLQQLVQSTPAAELPTNDLVKEFADRCQSAHRSVQAYINCDSPPPDDDTMQTLIETSEQLSLAQSKHQRAMLAARRTVSSSPPPGSQSGQNVYNTNQIGSTNSGFAPPPGPPPGQQQESSVISPVSPVTASYNAPPLPPTSLRAGLQRRQSELENTQKPATSTSDDPFSDEHAQPHPLEPAHYGINAKPDGAGDSSAGVEERFGRMGLTEGTPSYLGRQESSTNHLTMSGAGTSPERRRGEAGQVPPGGDVSPIEQRTVTYRY